MDDEEDEFDRAEDEDGHGGARFPRWHDRGADGTRQEVGAAEGHVGGGDSISSVEQGGAADSPFDGQPVGHSGIARMEMTAMSGPFLHPTSSHPTRRRCRALPTEYSAWPRRRRKPTSRPTRT